VKGAGFGRRPYCEGLSQPLGGGRESRARSILRCCGVDGPLRLMLHYGSVETATGAYCHLRSLQTKLQTFRRSDSDNKLASFSLSRDRFNNAYGQGRLDDAGELQIGARKQSTKLFSRSFPAPRRHHQHLDVAHLGGVRH